MNVALKNWFPRPQFAHTLLVGIVDGYCAVRAVVGESIYVFFCLFLECFSSINLAQM